jgi:hypothetical protein
MLALQTVCTSFSCKKSRHAQCAHDVADFCAIMLQYCLLLMHTQDFYASKSSVASIGTSIPLHHTEASIVSTIKQCISTNANTEQTVARKTAIARLEVSTDDTQFDACNPQDRVFTVTPQSDTVSATQIQLQLHVPTAAMEHIKTQYIILMQQRVLLLKQALKQQRYMPFEAMPVERMQELVYLSPVFIPVDDINDSTKHALTYGTYSNSNGSNSTTIDESKYPHIVFYIIPYSTASNAAITSAILCGKRGDDKLTFVIRLPQGLALHPGAAEVSLLITTWLSELAGFKLDMFLLPDNW